MAEKPFEKPIAEVSFLQVKTAEQKLFHVVQKAELHFRKKDYFLIFVEDEKIEQFVDDLLWKLPLESFLPHKILENFEKIPVGITRTKKNFNEAKIAFNLCPTPLLLPGFRKIYEFEDLSSPTKQKLSSLRFSSYRQASYLLTTDIK